MFFEHQFEHIRKISEESCVNEEMAAQHSALHRRNTYFKILLFLLYVWSNKCSLDENKSILLKKHKIFPTLNLIDRVNMGISLSQMLKTSKYIKIWSLSHQFDW